MGDRGAAGFDRPEPFYELSDREQVAFHLLGSGYSSAEIARRMSVSPRTADAYRRRILRKLNLKDTAAAIRLYGQTQMRPEATPALYLAEAVLPALTGATVLCPFVRDAHYCGLLLRRPDGQSVKMWILRDSVGDQAGWVVLE